MADLVSWSGGLTTRESRRFGRDLARLHGDCQVEIARIGMEADLQAERVSAVAHVGRRALHETAMLSQLEVQLSALVPSAMPRLQGIGDVTALGMADVVAETIRKVR